MQRGTNKKMDLKQANYLKEGFKKTNTFKVIVDGAIEGMKKKGWDGDNPLGEASELFRPLFEELYLGGCVQGVNGARKEVSKIIQENYNRIDMAWKIANDQYEPISHISNPKSRKLKNIMKRCEIKIELLKDLKRELDALGRKRE